MYWCVVEMRRASAVMSSRTPQDGSHEYPPSQALTPCFKVVFGRPGFPVRTSSTQRSKRRLPYRRSPSVTRRTSPVCSMMSQRVSIACWNRLCSRFPQSHSHKKRLARSCKAIVHPNDSSGGTFLPPFVYASSPSITI